WYKTGDIGEITPEKYLRIIGRDTFKLVLQNGENVFVEDLEKKINAHHAISTSCVIGLDDSGADKIFGIFILKNKEDEERIDEIVKEINQKLESKQQIQEYAIWKNDDFPRTHTLKINRRQVKEVIIANRETGQNTEVEVETAANSQMDIYDVISLVSKKDRKDIKDDMILTSDLDMDSLLRAELTAVVEENMGIVIDAVQINAQTSVSDIKNMVKDAEVKALSAPHFPTWQYNKFWDSIRYLIMKFIVLPLQALFIKIELEAPESFDRFDPSGRIVIYNHPGLFDFLVLMRVVGKPHKAVGLAAQGFWTNKLISRLMELGGSFPLDQTGGQLIQQSQIVSDLLDDDRYVILAPQGTIQRVQGTEDPFQTGIGFLADELDVPILPVKVKGYDKIMIPPPMGVGEMGIMDWLKYGRPHKIGKVKVVVGEEMLFDKNDSPEKITKAIQDTFDKM
ncbi:1-acyl-sn-glycerol-3-phosphate acyltransferase, partial [Candidatus Dojkabacteria bacterium]|nr:1-acyl-sn-glycerol-3-phosphate acyltransferase [Candidatus Dojkabacteria bacterium]